MLEILAAARSHLLLMIFMSLGEWFYLATSFFKSTFDSSNGLVLSLHWFDNACVISFEVVLLEEYAPLCVAAVLYRCRKVSSDMCDWLSLLSSSGINSGEMQHGSVKVDHRRLVSTDSLFKEIYDDSEDEDDEVGYADPVQDDLYARKMGVKSQPAGNESHDKFLPKFWIPDEDVHIQKIKLGSQRRPWYKKMQGFRCVKSLKSSTVRRLLIYTLQITI